MSEIERSAHEIYDAAKEIEGSEQLGANQAVVALLWVIDEHDDGRHQLPPIAEDGPAIARSANEVEKQIELVEDSRQKLYAQNATRAADCMAAATTAYKWVLGKNDTYNDMV